MKAKIKRGQAAAGTAVLLAIIAGLLVMFVILIAPAERAELLGEELDTVDIDSGDEFEEAELEENILTVSPGRIDYLSQKEIEHSLPVVNIFTKTESQIIAEKNIVSAKRAVFTDQPTTFKFPISDLTHTEGLILSFNVKEASGRLMISLNGESIFDSEIIDQVLPINLPKNQLQNENELIFSVSSPGVAFWKTHEISLENVKVVGEVTSVESQSSKNMFLVSETEKSNLEKVVLKFQPTCKFNDVGKLAIIVNGQEIYSSVPDCDLAFVPIEFSPDLLFQGENQVIFMTERGTYLLSHIIIESKLKDIEFPTYYFELSYEQYQEIANDDLRVRLKMDFVDIVTSKYGNIVFNGHVRHFDTKELSYFLDLSDDVVQGNNALKIKPKKTLEVREIKVDLVK